MKNKISVIVTVLLFLSVLGVGAYYIYDLKFGSRAYQQSDVATMLQDKDNVPITLTTTAGEAITLEDYSSKVQVITSWATWCPVCGDLLKSQAEIVNEYADEVVVIAVNRSEADIKVERYKEKFALPDSIVFAQDRDDGVYASLGGFAMPETVIFDTAGDLVLHYRGALPAEELKSTLTELTTR